MAPVHSRFWPTPEEFAQAWLEIPYCVIDAYHCPSAIGWEQKVCLLGTPGSVTCCKLYTRPLSSFLSDSFYIWEVLILRNHLAQAGAVCPDKDFSVMLHPDGSPLLLVSFSFCSCQWRWRLGSMPFEELCVF